MKAFVVVCMLFVCATALPARKSDSEELFSRFFGFPTRFREDISTSSSKESEESSESWPFFSPFFNPFRNFDPIPSIFRVPHIPSIPSPEDLDPKMTNSTSETKVVDGHKFVVNKTYYDNPLTHTRFEIKTIVIHRDDSGVTDDKATTDPDVEATTYPNLVKNPEDNEVVGEHDREPLGDPTTRDVLLA